MPQENVRRPSTDEYFEYFEAYISKFAPEDFWTAFAGQSEQLKLLLGDLPPGEDSKLHAPYTWTLKQALGHVIDAERVMSTRLLRIAVGDSTPNPDFNQDLFVAGLDYTEVSMAALIEEFTSLRRSNCLLVRRLTEDQLSRSGTVSDRFISARSLVYLLGGHFQYHFEIMSSRVASSN